MPFWPAAGVEANDTAETDGTVAVSFLTDTPENAAAGLPARSLSGAAAGTR